MDFTSTADIAVILPGGATIELVGDNTITNANSNTCEESSYGIYVEGNLTIGGSGTLTVTGGMSVFSDGIYVSSYYNGESRVGGRLTITGGTVTARGGKAKYSYGIYTDGGVTISGGHVIAQTLAKTASFASALSSKPDLSKYAGYQWCIIPNGKFTSSTDTAYTYNASHTYVEFAKGSAVTTYTVSFNANGGSGSMDAVTGVSGSYTLPANGFTAPYGKQFKGWSTSAGGTVITNTSITVTENTTLYAVWEDIPVTTYTVTFDANGGSVTPAGAETGEDGKPESLPTPTREGYTFDGWFTAADGGEKVTTDTVFEQNTTIYAHWTKESSGVNSDDSSSGSGSGDSTGSGSLPSDKPDSGKALTDDTAMPMVMVGVAILALAALVVLVVLFVMKKRQSRKG